MGWERYMNGFINDYLLYLHAFVIAYCEGNVILQVCISSSFHENAEYKTKCCELRIEKCVVLFCEELKFPRYRFLGVLMQQHLDCICWHVVYERDCT